MKNIIQNSKEQDYESRLADHGVRKYDYDIGRFTSTDVLFEKYYGWSPYQYSANNPINLLDWNGKEVKATDENARQAIINSVEEEHRGNIGFSDDGTVYLKEKTEVPELKNDLSNFSNYAALRALVNTERESFTVTTSDKSDIYVTATTSFYKMDLDNYSSSGSFLPRKSSGEQQTSLSGNEVKLNPLVYQNNLTQNEGRINTPSRVVAHELLGHGLLWYWKTYKGWNKGYSHDAESGEIIKKAERNVDK